MTCPDGPIILDPDALAALAEVTGGDSEFLGELIDMFVAESPDMLSGMTMAVTDGDAPGLRRAAHTLKSNARTFGATALAAVCQEIEERATTSDTDGIGDLIDCARRLFPAVAAALDAERAVK